MCYCRPENWQRADHFFFANSATCLVTLNGGTVKSAEVLMTRNHVAAVPANLFDESGLAILLSYVRITERDFYETRYPPSIRHGDRSLRMREHISDQIHPGRDPHGHLRQLPPFLYGQAEARRYSGTC